MGVWVAPETSALKLSHKKFPVNTFMCLRCDHIHQSRYNTTLWHYHTESYYIIHRYHIYMYRDDDFRWIRNSHLLVYRGGVCCYAGRRQPSSPYLLAPTVAPSPKPLQYPLPTSTKPLAFRPGDGLILQPQHVCVVLVRRSRATALGEDWNTCLCTYVYMYKYVSI
jgi:hypothetical protein